MPKVDLITPEQERTLLSAMHDAVKYANAGDKPTVAVVKSARQHALGPEFTQRLVEAFNASKTVSHLRKTSGEQRAESFELANGAEAVKQLYEDEPVSKAARTNRLAAADFFAAKPSTLLKAAGTQPTKPKQKHANLRSNRVRKLQGLKQQLAKAGADLREHMVRAQETAKELFIDAAEMFKQGNDFAEVERRVVGTYGKAGHLVMDKLWGMADYERFGQKRAGVQDGPAVMGHEPVYDTMRSLMQVLDSAGDLHVAYAQYKQAVDEVTTEEAAEASGELDEAAAAEPSAPFQQAMNANMNVPIQLAKLLVSSTKKPAPTAAKKTDDAAAMAAMADKVITPSHEAKIRSIKARVMLNDFIVNDPVISGYPPADVISAFNQISRMVPGVSSEPLVMRGLVARVLQTGGRFDPHEANTLFQTDAAQRSGRTRGY